MHWPLKEGLALSTANGKLLKKCNALFAKAGRKQELRFVHCGHIGVPCFMGHLRSFVKTVTGDKLLQQIGNAHECLAFPVTIGNVRLTTFSLIWQENDTNKGDQSKTLRKKARLLLQLSRFFRCIDLVKVLVTHIWSWPVHMVGLPRPKSDHILRVHRCVLHFH